MATKGLLAKKIGMTQVFTEKGELLPVTVLEAGPCTVVGLRAVQKDGYGAVQLGFGEVEEKKLTRATAGHFKKAGVKAHRHLKEIRLKADAGYAVGQALKADLFAAGELVDVTGTSKGKGFSGQHKRHHFGRGPVTHGSHNIKQPGSIGSCCTRRCCGSRPTTARAPTRPRLAARFPVAARSPGNRRAPGGPARAAPGRRSGATAGWSSVRTRVATSRRCRASSAGSRCAPRFR